MKQRNHNIPTEQSGKVDLRSLFTDFQINFRNNNAEISNDSSRSTAQSDPGHSRWVLPQTQEVHTTQFKVVLQTLIRCFPRAQYEFLLYPNPERQSGRTWQINSSPLTLKPPQRKKKRKKKAEADCSCTSKTTP